MDQPPHDNQTDFKVHPQLFVDKDGEKLVAVVKATFEVEAPTGGASELAPKKRRRPVRLVDVPWDKKKPASLAYPSDVCLRKPGTDVVFVAVAYAPGGKAVPYFDVYAQVGSMRRMARIFGVRAWQVDGAGISPPQPTAKQIEMKYDYAWGGVDDSDKKKFVEEARNPIGMGVARDPSWLSDKPAPCIEDPASLIQSHKTRPAPAGIAMIGRHWQPRRGYAGTYDAQWEENRAPLLPEDEDDRFNFCASPGLTAVPPLVGGEEVKLLNLVPGGGPTLFQVPRAAVEIEFRVKDREPEVFRPHVDTVLVDLLGLPGLPIAVELVWRAYVKAPKRLLESKIIVREAAWGAAPK
jgi:hypothetical protein